MDVEKLFFESPEFKTIRLLLRRMDIHDAQDYFNFASDPEVTTFTLWETHKTIDDSIQYLNRVIEKYKSKQSYHWGIVDIASKKLIGRTGLVSWDPAHHKTEIGFALSKQYWNQGVVTEATREVISYCFNNLDVNRIEGRCNQDNVGSARAMEKLGMSLEGILREQLKIKGLYKNQKMYSILRRDFVG